MYLSCSFSSPIRCHRGQSRLLRFQLQLLPHPHPPTSSPGEGEVSHTLLFFPSVTALPSTTAGGGLGPPVEQVPPQHEARGLSGAQGSNQSLLPGFLLPGAWGGSWRGLLGGNFLAKCKAAKLCLESLRLASLLSGWEPEWTGSGCPWWAHSE